MRIGKRLGLGFGILVSLFILLSVVPYFSLRTTGDQIDILHRHSNEMEAIGDLQTLFGKILMPANDYIITADLKCIKEFDELSQSVEKQIEKAEGLGLNPEEKIVIQGVKANYSRIKDLSRDIMLIKIEPGNPEAARLMEEMDYRYGYPSIKSLERVREIARKDMKEAHLKSHKLEVGTMLLGVFISLFSILIGIIIGIKMTRSISLPLLKLTDVSAVIAGGDLTKRAEIKSNDEIGELAVSFNHMADEVQKRNEELQTMNEELNTSNEELQSTTEELEAANEELRTAQEELVQKEKLAAVGQLAAGIGHELRNPLGVIKNAAYYIKSKIGAEDPKLAKHLDIMDREINNSNKIISDLLNFSRTRKPDLIPTEINAVIEEAIPAADLPENVRVNRNLATGLPKPSIDRDQIRQVFLNMILNACQAMPQGGELKITSQLHKAGFKIVGKEKDCIEIAFADTGTGIAPENLKKMFNPFFTTKAKGIGLGLAVSKGIITAHQGDIEIKSELNRGTTFIIKLGV